MTPLESAFPLNSNWPAATVRSKLAEAMIAVFDTPDLSGEDFSIQPYPAIAVYGPDGDLTLYAFDATDTVTADDGGVSCIVVSGRRYKRSGEVIVRDAAISATTSTQPPSPSLGDTYIIPDAPSGDDWASQAKTVATFTARGWIFRQPFVGMMVYVEDTDTVWHYNSDGDWIAGIPIGAIPDGSIPPKKLTYPFAILKVEDERNAPPGSAPTAGTMYQIGTSPTGAFAGHSREIARWTGSEYEFITPSEGDTIYRKDVDRLYTYRSGAWTITVPMAAVQRAWIYEFSGFNFTNVGGAAVRHTGIDIQSEVGKRLRFTFFSFTGVGSGGDGLSGNAYAVRFYRDSETQELIKLTTDSTNGETGPTLSFNSPSDINLSAEFALPNKVRPQIIVPVIDNASHNYNIGIIRTSGSDNGRDFNNTSAFVLVEEMEFQS